MLLLSLLVLGCSAARQLSPDTMRALISGAEDARHVPQVYHQLRKLLSIPDNIRNMGNTARPLILNPVPDHSGDCVLLAHAPRHKFHSVEGAELHLFLPTLVPDGRENDVISIMVKRRLPQGVRQDQYVVSWSEDWVQLNITQSLDEFNYWLRNGICVSAVVDGATVVPDARKFSDDATGDNAFVMMWSTEVLSLPQNSKSKRSHIPQRDKFRDNAFRHAHIGPNPNRSAKFGNRCSLESFFIDFRDLGWDSWIIYPLGLELGICSGVCMQDDFLTNYNLIMNSIARDPQLYRLYSLAGIRMERTCAPTTLLPSVLMFIDEGKDVVVQLVQDMVVGGCGCV